MLARIPIEGYRGQLFQNQMILNISINKKTTELSNQKENLTKNISPIISIYHFMRKTFVFLRKFLSPSKLMMMMMMMMMMIKIMVQKQTAQTMYLNSRVLLANNSIHLYVNLLRKLFLDCTFNFYDYVLFQIFFIFIYISTQKLFLSFLKKNLLPLIARKKNCMHHK